MPRTHLYLAALTLSLLSLGAQAEKLRIVTEPWAPYVYVEGTEAKGVDYEVTALVFQRLGIEVQWQFLPWKRCLAMLAQGQADGILDIFQTDQRLATLMYPGEPLSTVEFVLYQNSDSPHRITTLDDLAGLTVGTSPGYAYGDAFMQSKAFRKETAPTHEANFGKLMRDRVDLVITDRRVGQHLINQMGLLGQVSELPLVVLQQKQYLALRRNAGMDLLVQRFSAELKRFKQEPQYRELVRRYAATEQALSQAALKRRMPAQMAVEQHEGGAM
jgi:polar amino acid transport system substrate-binding protein